MRTTHAIFSRIPDELKSDDKKKKADVALLRKQQDEFRATLHEAGVHLIDLPEGIGGNGKSAPSLSSLLIGDLVIVINGVALLTRPKKDIYGSRLKQIFIVLFDLTWIVHETPATENGKPIVLEAADVLFTGREIFVGIRKGGTNFEGAMIVGRVFRDYPVITIPMHEKANPLKHYISMVSDKVISIGTSKEAQNILERVEREASFRYKRITVDDEAAVGCINVNDRLIFRADIKDPKYNVLQGSGIELWAMDCNELAKAGSPFSRHCILLDVHSGRGKTTGTLTRSVTGSVGGSARHSTVGHTTVAGVTNGTTVSGPANGTDVGSNGVANGTNGPGTEANGAANVAINGAAQT